MLFKDLAFAFRTLRRTPVFTVTAVSTIALGIAASTAIFSVTNAVLLRDLPYRDPERLVVMYMDLRNRNNFAMPLSNERPSGQFQAGTPVASIALIRPSARPAD